MRHNKIQKLFMTHNLKKKIFMFLRESAEKK